jgi:Uma2 family endonuclease
MSAARPLVVPPDPASTDHFVYLQASWQDYERLLAMRGEGSVPRMTYLEGVVELMSPSRFHETDKTRFARLLETWSEFAGVPLEGYGSWTLKDEKQDRGAEPDECYMVRRMAVDDDDRPDIAIEVIWTRGGIDKLEVYRKLGVREVWFYERGSLRFFALRQGAGGALDLSGTLDASEARSAETQPAESPAQRRGRTDAPGYAEIPRSELLPELPVDLLLACMQAPGQSAAVRTLRTALQAGA